MTAPSTAIGFRMPERSLLLMIHAEKIITRRGNGWGAPRAMTYSQETADTLIALGYAAIYTPPAQTEVERLVLTADGLRLARHETARKLAERAERMVNARQYA